LLVWRHLKKRKQLKSGGLISYSSYVNVGKGSWGKDELVESSEEGSEEGV